MSNQVLVVLVLYKKKLSESECYRSLENSASNFHYRAIDLYIYDNSPEPQYIEPTEIFNIIYVHDPTNPGVSRGYNRACKMAESLGKDWILIFDQDTILPLNAIEVYFKAILDADPDMHIIAPILINRGKMISPCNYIFHRGFPLSSTPEMKFPLKGHSFLNSGLLLKVNFIKEIGYFDENLFDYSDHDFISRSAKKYKYANIIDVRLKHSWSSSDDTSECIIKKRFNMLAKASFYMAKKYNTFLPIFWLFLRSIKLFLRTKRIEYVKIALKGD